MSPDRGWARLRGQRPMATATSQPAPIAAAEPADQAALRDEAVRFGRYILGVEPSPALIDRYVKAHATVLHDPPTADDEAILGFVRAQPWALGLLDAGTAFVKTAPRLRQKLVVMTAILEATPAYAERTLPVDGLGLPRLLLRLGVAGALAGAKLVGGAVVAAAVIGNARRHARAQGAA